MHEQPEQLAAYEQRFGNIAVEKGFITQQQLIEALNSQVIEEISYGRHSLFGKILLDQNCITMVQVEMVLNDLLKG